MSCFTLFLLAWEKKPFVWSMNNLSCRETTKIMCRSFVDDSYHFAVAISKTEEKNVLHHSRFDREYAIFPILWWKHKMQLGFIFLFHQAPTNFHAWWRHQMETSSMLLALCAGNSPVTGEFPHKGQWRGVLMFSLICALNNRLSKQSWCWWFETLLRPLWRHCNDYTHRYLATLFWQTISTI